MNKTIVTLILLTSVASASLYAEGKHGGGHAGAHWMAPQDAANKPNPIKTDAASIDRGKKVYFQNCASCHGAKAMGDGPAAATLNPKPANLTVMAGMHPDGDFAWKIANGRGAMPAWKSVLKENQIWDLVNYIQNLKPKGKAMNMAGMQGMDHSNMNMQQMRQMMKQMMPNMDASKMNMQQMQQMMAKMKGNMAGGGHSNSDGHHDAKPVKASSSHDEKPHSH